MTPSKKPSMPQSTPMKSQGNRKSESSKQSFVKKVLDKVTNNVRPVSSQRKFLFDGGLNIVWFNNAQELTAYMRKKFPKTHGQQPLIYGEFVPANQYIYFGTLYLSKESSAGLIAHEVYHAIQHVIRTKGEVITSMKEYNNVLQDRVDREERHANMFGQLLNQLLEEKEQHEF